MNSVLTVEKFSHTPTMHEKIVLFRRKIFKRKKTCVPKGLSMEELEKQVILLNDSCPTPMYYIGKDKYGNFVIQNKD